MGFLDGINSLAASIIDGLGGEPVVYTLPGESSGMSIQAICDPVDFEDFGERGQRITRRMLRVHARVQDIPHYVRGASVEYKGAVYTVAKALYRDEGMIGLQCEQLEVRQRGAREARQ
jgi:hypothetical protein